jgi:ABC-type multidrug transport system fused ATPase/permease subunit
MKSLFKIRFLIGKYWGYFLVSIIGLLGIIVTRLYVPTLIRSVIDEGIAESNSQLIFTVAITIFVLGIIKGIFSGIQKYASEYIAMNVAYDMRNKLFNHFQHLSFTYHDHAQTGQLMSRSTEDVRSTQQFIGSGFIELLNMVLLSVGSLYLMFQTNAKLGMIALLSLVPLFIITTNLGKKVSNLFYSIDKALGDLSSKLQENVSGAQVVRAFTRESFEIDRFSTSNKILYDARVNVIYAWGSVMPTTTLIISISTILILWFGGQMVMDGLISIGNLVAFNSYLLILAIPAQQITMIVAAAGEAAAGIERVLEVLNTTPTIVSKSTPLAAKNIKGKIEFKNVNFKYHGEDNYALENINFKVSPNTTIAIIGATGSGKTSLINLISRFYDSTDGNIMIDGKDIKEYDLIEYRKRIGVVLQTSLLFSASIRENISFGNPKATEDQIFDAAKAAQAHKFIMAMPERYDTVVGERGITLSGGQRQRIAIARAILINPAILILDDATSSIDTETEHYIHAALEKVMENRTTFIIAQRLSTILNADEIYVLDKGKIVETGTHQSLINKNGIYKEIYNLQLLEQEKYIKEVENLKLNSGGNNE